MDEIIRSFPCTRADLENDPRGRVTDSLLYHWIYVVTLFPEDAVVWIGRDTYDSGRPGHRWRFRTASQWLRAGKNPGVYICPNSFYPGVVSRSNENVIDRNFLVIEADVISHDDSCSVFKFLEAAYPEMRLRAVVDTGGKSLHAWFDYPSPETLEALPDILPRLGCDPAMLKPSQPTRLPGSRRKEAGSPQRLIYFPLD